MSKKKKPAGEKNFFEYFATKVTKATGTTPVFITAFITVLVWAATGPFFDFSETWQLVINTGTTIITFLMVFLIQKTQNKDSLAIHLKLNELVASSRFASNRLVDVEDLTEEEMEVLKKFYTKLSDLSEQEDSLIISHSIDEAQENHEEKHGKPTTRQHSGNGNNHRRQQRGNIQEAKSVSASIDADVIRIANELNEARPKPKKKRRKPRPNSGTDQTNTGEN